MVASAPSQYTSSGFVPIQVQQSGLALPQPHSSGTIPMQPQEPKESKPIYANNLPPALQAAQNAAMKPGPTFNSGTGFKPRITSMFASPPPTYFAATGQKSGASLDTSSGAFSMFFDKKEETPVDRGASSLFARTSR